MTEEDEWEVEKRALQEVLEDLSGKIKERVSALMQGIQKCETESLSDS